MHGPIQVAYDGRVRMSSMDGILAQYITSATMDFEDRYSLVDEIHAKCDFSVNRNTRFVFGVG